MTPRERVLACLEHRPCDRVPLAGSFRPEVWEKLYARFGTRDSEQVTQALGLDFRGVGMGVSERWRARAQPTPLGWRIPHEDGSYENEWGIRQAIGPNSPYMRYVCQPLADAARLDSYRFPDLDAPGVWDSVAERANALKGQYVVSAGVGTFFRTAWDLRGLEDWLCDLHWNPTFVERLVGRLLERHLEIVRRYARMGVDIISVGGDIAMHRTLFMQPDIWRRYFKGPDAQLIEEARRWGVKHFFFHSDGNLWPVLADLVDIGFDIIDPIQPECMDPVEVKREFGERITLHGTISSQHTLPFGTVEEVRAEVRQRIRDLGYNGGLVIAPNNVVQYDVPLENLLAVYDEAKQCSAQ